MNDYAQRSCNHASHEEIHWYLQDLATMPVLSLKAEQEVVQQIAAAPASVQADAARTLLIEANLRLVVRLARRYQPFGPEFADLIQEGNLALMQAAQQFDPERSHHFRVFAMQRVRRALHRVVEGYLRENHLIDPEGEMESFSPLRAAVVKALAHAALDEQALVVDLPAERCTSLDVLLAEADTDTSLFDGRESDHLCCHETSNESNPDESYFVQERSASMSACLQQLTTRERQVLARRYLLDPAQSLEEVGRTLSITREQVRQLEQRGLRRLRHPHHAKILLGLL